VASEQEVRPRGSGESATIIRLCEAQVARLDASTTTVSASKRPRLMHPDEPDKTPMAEDIGRAPPSTVRPPKDPGSVIAFRGIQSPAEAASSSRPDGTPASQAQTPAGEDGGPLSREEEAILLRHWELQSLALGMAAKLPRDITSTAIVYQKRFWLSASPREYDPAEIAGTCFFLAIKVEADPYLEVSDMHQQLCAVLGSKVEQLSKHEADVMMGLRFHLSLWHCGASVRGLLQRVEGVSPEDIEALTRRALHFADIGQTTDAPLLSSPSQMALSCISLACQTHPTLSAPLNAAPPAEASRAVLESVGSIIAGGPDRRALVDRLSAAILAGARTLDLSEQARVFERRRRAHLGAAFARTLE
jgi:hypothetical protein